MPGTLEEWLNAKQSTMELFRCELTLGVKCKFNISELKAIAEQAPFNLSVADFATREALSEAMLLKIPAPKDKSKPNMQPSRPSRQPTTAGTQAMLVASAFQKLVEDGPEQVSADIMILNRISHVMERLDGIEHRLKQLQVPSSNDVKQLERLLRRMNSDYAIWDAEKVENILKAATDNSGHIQTLRELFNKLDQCVPVKE